MFSFKRFFEQFKITILQNAFRHGMLLLLVSLFLMFRHYLYFHTGGQTNGDLFDSALFIISLMGIVNSIDVFGKLRRTDSGIHYMMLPANTSEKFAAAWLYTTVFTFGIYLVTYYLVHFFSMSIGNLLTGYGLPYQHISAKSLWEIFAKMMFIQSIYFLGSLFFRKNTFVKTTAVMFGCIMVIAIIGSYIFKNALEGMDMSAYNSVNFNWNENGINDLPLPLALYNIANVLKVIFYLIPFGCWFGSYIKLKKMEI